MLVVNKKLCSDLKLQYKLLFFVQMSKLENNVKFLFTKINKTAVFLPIFKHVLFTVSVS